MLYRCERCGQRIITTPHTAYCDGCRPLAMADFNRERRTLSAYFARLCEEKGDRSGAERLRKFADLHYRN